MNWIQVITAFMASAPGTKAEQQALKEIADGLGRRNIEELVFGGGNTGLMRDFAAYCQQAGVSQVTGYIPQFMLDALEEYGSGDYQAIADIEHSVESMDMRKLHLIERCDVGLTFPGATGTLEELFQFITTQEFKRFAPEEQLSDMIVLNLDGFYDHIKAHMERIVSTAKKPASHFTMLHFVDDAPGLLARLDEIDRRGPLHGRDLC
jgi:predicted Rossmann-fold nucleotide-binding protein